MFKRFFDGKGVAIAITASGILTILSIIIIANGITPEITNAFLSQLYMWILIGVASLSSIVFITCIVFLILCLIMHYKAMKAHLKSLSELRKLNYDFKDIEISNWEKYPLSHFVPNEQIKCQVKTDDLGNLVYRVYIDYEGATQNYLAFFDVFHS